MADRNQLLWVGVGLLGAGVISSLLAAGTGVDVIGGFSGTFVFFGIVILLVSAFRGGGSRQQQQQQVVIVQGNGGAAPAGGPSGGPSGQPAIRCPQCKGLSPNHARFCGECGASLGRATARP